MVAFINRNDRRADYDIRTPRPNTNTQTLYFAAPFPGGLRLPVVQMDADGVSRLRVAPAGNAVSWFVSQPLAGAGLHVLDLATGISARVLAIDNLQQRQYFSEARWAPDGSHLVIAVATAWASDIFSIRRENGAIVNLTSHDSRDLWPGPVSRRSPPALRLGPRPLPGWLEAGSVEGLRSSARRGH